MANAFIEHIRMCHVNCQSLFAHLDKFRLFFNDSGFQIICLSETWLRDGVTDDLVRLPGYSLHRCDRVGRQGGGVALYLEIICTQKYCAAPLAPCLGGLNS